MNHLVNRTHLFDDLFRDVASGFFVKPVSTEATSKNLKVDILDTGDSYQSHADIAGVEKDDIQVDIDGAVGSLKAELKQPVDRQEDSKVLHSERQFGTVARRFELPAEIDADKSVAEYKDGVLTLTLPKKVPQDTQKRLTIN